MRKGIPAAKYRIELNRGWWKNGSRNSWCGGHGEKKVAYLRATMNEASPGYNLVLFTTIHTVHCLACGQCSTNSYWMNVIMIIAYAYWEFILKHQMKPFQWPESSVLFLKPFHREGYWSTQCCWRRSWLWPCGLTLEPAHSPCSVLVGIPILTLEGHCKVRTYSNYHLIGEKTETQAEWLAYDHTASYWQREELPIRFWFLSSCSTGLLGGGYT